MYKKIHGTKNNMTTMKWELYVKRALCLPSELEDFREQTIAM
jgi:hypothetical protein